MEGNLRIYIASFFDTRNRLREVRSRLQAAGIVVTSRWLDEDLASTYDTSSPEYLQMCARRDAEDIARSHALAIDTIDITPRGGREVELGMAMAWGKSVMRVGPPRNVFHHLLETHFDTWDEAIGFLSERGRPLVTLA